MATGYIYKITNLKNGKAYIGQTKNSAQSRFNQHIADAKNKNRSSYNYPLYKAFRKHGLKNFCFEVIKECSVENLDKEEIRFIKKFDTCNSEKGYNQTFGGQGTIIRLAFSEKEVIKKYKELKKIYLVAEHFGCARRTVQNILNKNNVEITSQKDHMYQKEAKKVFQYDLEGNLLNTFNSLTLAGTYLIENNLTSCSSASETGKQIKRKILLGNPQYKDFCWKVFPEYSEEQKESFRITIDNKKKRRVSA